MLINFDFDGVIADTFNGLLALCIAAQKSVDSGRTPVKEDLQNLEDLTFEGMAHHLEIPTQTVPEFLRIVFQLQQKEKESVEFFPGMASLLNLLSQDNTIAIITSSSAELIRYHLFDHDVLDAITSISGNETGRSKMQSLLANMTQYMADPEQTCMIGDAVSDIRQGKAAGVITIGVGWGFHSKTFLLKEKPSCFADSPLELQEVLHDLRR